MSSFIAQFEGHCAACGGRIYVGQHAEYNIDGFIEHVNCPDHTSITPPKNTALCKSCFTYHKGECI